MPARAGEQQPEQQAGEQADAPRPPKRKLVRLVTTAALPLLLACVIPVATADDGVPARAVAAESLFGASVGLAGAFLAKASDKLPDWVPPEVAMSGGATIGALLPAIRRHAPSAIKRARACLLGSPEPTPLAVPPSISDDPAAEIVGDWAKQWDRARVGKPSSATPLGIFGDKAVHALGEALAQQVRADAGRDLLEVDVSACDGQCAAKIEGFMVDGSLRNRPGLILLKNAHAFDGTVEANSQRFRDTIAGLETALGPTADGGLRVSNKSPKCPKGTKCRIVASLFAFLTTSPHLDGAKCAALRDEATSPNSMRYLAKRERKLTVWADALFDSRVQGLLGATNERWASNAVLACRAP